MSSSLSPYRKASYQLTALKSNPFATSIGSMLIYDLSRKIPWRLSAPQKARQRKRLRAVDSVVDTLSAALKKNYNGQTTKSIERWYAEMPSEEEMVPKDKYTLFDRKERTYRKGIHSELLQQLQFTDTRV